jgi:uncharacterized protein (DUF1697 family)
MSQQKFIALLRGVNVGGTSRVNMGELKSTMIDAGFENVSSYINSGNIIFCAKQIDTRELAILITTIIRKHFGHDIDVIVLSKNEWSGIINNAPKWWGHDSTRKHNLIVLLRPDDIDSVIEAMGELNNNIESAVPGNGVVYQSLSLKDIGKTTCGKLATNPICKRMTIRNHNTVTKILTLLG